MLKKVEKSSKILFPDKTKLEDKRSTKKTMAQHLQSKNNPDFRKVHIITLKQFHETLKHV